MGGALRVIFPLQLPNDKSDFYFLVCTPYFFFRNLSITIIKIPIKIIRKDKIKLLDFELINIDIKRKIIPINNKIIPILPLLF